MKLQAMTHLACLRVPTNCGSQVSEPEENVAVFIGLEFVALLIVEEFLDLSDRRGVTWYAPLARLPVLLPLLRHGPPLR